MHLQSLLYLTESYKLKHAMAYGSILLHIQRAQGSYVLDLSTKP